MDKDGSHLDAEHGRVVDEGLEAGVVQAHVVNSLNYIDLTTCLSSGSCSIIKYSGDTNARRGRHLNGGKWSEL